MITPEKYAEIAQSIEAGSPVSIEDTRELVLTIQELDAQAIILQNALNLAYDNAMVIVEALAETVMSRCGRTDTKTKRAVGKIAGNAAARYELALNAYLLGAFEEAKQMLNPDTLNDEIAAAGEETDEGVSA